jgi:hypothetical protein
VVKGWRGIRKSDLVFYNPETGGQWKDLWLGLKKACRKAGLSNDVTWHTFRHTFASRLNGSGADLVTVQEILGHSDIKTTMRYAHTNREAKTNAVRRLGGSSDNDRAGKETGIKTIVTVDASCGKIREVRCGEVRERLNRAVSKTVEPSRVPWVRIPPSPPE